MRVQGCSNHSWSLNPSGGRQSPVGSGIVEVRHHGGLTPPRSGNTSKNRCSTPSPVRIVTWNPPRYFGAMRVLVSTIILFTCVCGAGCSNAPIAGTMDNLFPSKPVRNRNPGPRDLFDREKDPLPPPDLIPRDQDDPLPAPRSGGLRSNPRTEDPAPRLDPFRPRSNDPADPLPAPLPAGGFLDPVGPGRGN